VYIFGGIDKTQGDPAYVMNFIEKYSISNNEWEKVDIKTKFNYTLLNAGCF
jgi:N-acetylneuraminic acid mutarotase